MRVGIVQITLLVEGNTDIVSEEDVTEEMTLELQRMFDEGVSVSSAAKEVLLCLFHKFST